jgi:hypothetical protein
MSPPRVQTSLRPSIFVSTAQSWRRVCLFLDQSLSKSQTAFLSWLCALSNWYVSSSGYNSQGKRRSIASKALESAVSQMASFMFSTFLCSHRTLIASLRSPRSTDSVLPESKIHQKWSKVERCPKTWARRLTSDRSSLTNQTRDNLHTNPFLSSCSR